MKLTNKEMAHEMGNAIAVQEGLLELLEVEGLTGRQENLVNKLHRSVKLMGKMSKELAEDESAVNEPAADESAENKPTALSGSQSNKNRIKNREVQDAEINGVKVAEEKCKDEDGMEAAEELSSDNGRAEDGLEKYSENIKAEATYEEYSESAGAETNEKKHRGKEETESAVETEAENFFGFMENVCESLCNFADKKSLSFSYVNEVPEKALLKFDSDTAYQVLTNIVSNAAKYTDHGSIEVRSYLKDSVTARIDGETKGEKESFYAKSKAKEDKSARKGVPEKTVTELIFEVKDTGHGIAEKDKEIIFLPEVRLMSKSNGSGLGLAICRRLLAAARGEICLESSPGQGSVFSFSLPVADVRRREDDFC